MPLAPTAPEAAQRDEALYRMLALVDALRIGRPREQKLAVRLLKEALAHARLVTEAGRDSRRAHLPFEGERVDVVMERLRVIATAPES